MNYLWAVEWYVGRCRVCGLLYGMWAVVWNEACCMVYGIQYICAAAYLGC